MESPFDNVYMKLLNNLSNGSDNVFCEETDLFYTKTLGFFMPSDDDEANDLCNSAAVHLPSKNEILKSITNSEEYTFKNQKYQHLNGHQYYEFEAGTDSYEGTDHSYLIVRG
ncbi:Hypothetical protein POVR1_LOCUS291 [uncultured virus]|nr:Hypothetical protein POVR1_LOCUS291 [uncultured virus]